MKTALVRCPVCGGNRKVAPKTIENRACEGREPIFRSCASLLQNYGKEAVKEIQRLRTNGFASWDELKHLMELQGRDIETMDNRFAVYRTCRILGIEYQRKYNAEAALKSKKGNACFKHPCDICEQCGSAEHTEAHHVIPVEYGGETDGEMICLCHRCHRAAHREINARIRNAYGSTLAFRHSVFSQHSEEIAHLFTWVSTHNNSIPDTLS